MFNLIEGPIDEQTCALFQYTPLAPFGLLVSIDFYQIKDRIDQVTCMCYEW